jgi:hypothetical protein
MSNKKHFWDFYPDITYVKNGNVVKYHREDLVIDRLTIEVYRDLLMCFRHEPFDEIWIEWDESVFGVNTEIETLNTILE